MHQNGTKILNQDFEEEYLNKITQNDEALFIIFLTIFCLKLDLTTLEQNKGYKMKCWCPFGNNQNTINFIHELKKSDFMYVF